MVRAEVVPGDVLYTIAGSIGNACVVAGVDRANINQAIARMRPMAGLMPQYLADFLNTSFGQLQSRRIANGGVQLNINFSEVRALKLLVPPLDIQANFVDSLATARQAHAVALNEAARLLESIDHYLLGVLGITVPTEVDRMIFKRIFNTQRREIAGWRFDPQALHPEREAMREAVKRLPSRPLKRAARFCKLVVTDLPEKANYIGLENVESTTGRYVPSMEKETVSSAFLFKRGQVLFPKLRPYLNKVFLAPFDGFCSTEFHVLQGQSVSSEFLALFLRSQVVVRQTKHLMSGNTLPRLQTEDIEEILIPDIAEEIQRNVVEEAMRRMEEAERLRSNAEVSLAATKLAIEAALLGRVP